MTTAAVIVASLPATAKETLPTWAADYTCDDYGLFVYQAVEYRLAGLGQGTAANHLAASIGEWAGRLRSHSPEEKAFLAELSGRVATFALQTAYSLPLARAREIYRHDVSEVRATLYSACMQELSSIYDLR